MFCFQVWKRLLKSHNFHCNFRPLCSGCSLRESTYTRGSLEMSLVRRLPHFIFTIQLAGVSMSWYPILLYALNIMFYPKCILNVSKKYLFYRNFRQNCLLANLHIKISCNIYPPRSTTLHSIFISVYVLQCSRWLWPSAGSRGWWWQSPRVRVARSAGTTTATPPQSTSLSPPWYWPSQ